MTNGVLGIVTVLMVVAAVFAARGAFSQGTAPPYQIAEV